MFRLYINILIKQMCLLHLSGGIVVSEQTSQNVKFDCLNTNSQASHLRLIKSAVNSHSSICLLHLLSLSISFIHTHIHTIFILQHTLFIIKFEQKIDIITLTYHRKKEQTHLIHKIFKKTHLDFRKFTINQINLLFVLRKEKEDERNVMNNK